MGKVQKLLVRVYGSTEHQIFEFDI